MKNNIYCIFDLSKSVSHFQEKVTKILELTNIPEWNGQTFKLREKEIREFSFWMSSHLIANPQSCDNAYRPRICLHFLSEVFRCFNITPRQLFL